MAVQNKIAEMPGPVDDGWWVSVLAEEERNKPPVSPRPLKTCVERSVVRDVQPQGVSKGRSAGTERSVALRPQGVSKGRSVYTERSRSVERPIRRVAKRLESQANPSANWTRVQELFHSDEIISLTVTGFNRGGLLVEGEGLYGFVPFSHLVELAGSETAEREQALTNYVGRSLRLKIIECVPEDGRVVFSERAAQVEAGRRSEIFSNLQTGQKVRGLVTNITDFGVFVDLGGVEGLIHISELSWGRVVHPSQVVNLGQDVEILVMEIAADRCRVALSLKRLYDNPWLSVEHDFAVNQIVPATITSVVSYGAFARLDVGVEGLIHASEMHLEEGLTIKDILNEGQRLDVRVLHVDAAHQRMGLSLHLTGDYNN